MHLGAEIIEMCKVLTWLKEWFNTTRLFEKTDNLLLKQALKENVVNCALISPPQKNSLITDDKYSCLICIKHNNKLFFLNY